MKKIAIILAAALAAFSFASCNKEEVKTSPKDIKINISVASPYGTDTKAVKTGWVAGDKINIWVDAITDWGADPDLILTYNGSTWTAGELTRTPNGVDKLYAIYEGTNDWVNNYQHTYNYQYIKSTLYISGTGTFHCNPMTIVKNNIPYVYDGKTLTAEINDWDFITNVQVVVTGINADDANKYGLKCNYFTNVGCLYFSKQTSTQIERSGYSAGNYSAGVANEDGVAFYFNVNASYNGTKERTFTLADETGAKKTYNVTKDLQVDGKSVKAIKIDISKFE